MPNKKLQESIVVTPAEKTSYSYRPNERAINMRSKVYKAAAEMIDVKSQKYNEFGSKTLKQYLDCNNKRLNVYAVSNDSCDPPKEEWQANNPTTIIRDAMKKVMASFSLEVPEMEVKAYGENNVLDFDRAETAKWLINGSYLQEENPIIENFWESWECGSQGTVFKYEGYLKTKYKQKFIKSYDAITGRVEFYEKEVDVDDKCLSFLMPTLELYLRDFYIHNIQDQPDLCWIRYYDEELFNYEFGNYPDAKFVKTSAQLTDADTDNFYYQSKWKQRTNEKQPIEVIRYYNRLIDSYLIIANGVILMDAPLLWRVNGKKVYPFAKAIWEPFVNKHFAYGKSFTDSMAGKVDDYETTRNNMLDKQWKSMKPGLLVGRVNQDAFNLEDQWVTDSTQISVEDVNQVKEVPVQGINTGDVEMLRLISQEITDAAPALPNMLTKKNATAREIVLSEEHIQELRLIHKEMIADLWRQKFSLRLANIQLNYPQPRTIVEDNKQLKVYRTYVIDNATLDRETGEIGILAIQFKNFALKDKAKIQREVSVEEEMMRREGIAFKKRVVPEDYLDNYRVNIEVIPASLIKQSQGRKQAEILEKVSTIAKLFPQIVVLNQKEYFTQICEAYDDKPGKYTKKLDQYNQMKDEQVKQQKQGVMNEELRKQDNEQLKAISADNAVEEPE